MSAFERLAQRLAFRPMHCMAFLLTLVALLPAVAAFAAAPGDRSKLWDTCRKDDGEAGLTACMAIINTRGIPARERATAYYNRCYNYIMRHDYRNALANCDRALEDNPSYVDAWMNRTLIRSGLGQLDLAVRDATQALAVATNNSDAPAPCATAPRRWCGAVASRRAVPIWTTRPGCSPEISTILSTRPTSCCKPAAPRKRSSRSGKPAPARSRAIFRNPRPPLTSACCTARAWWR